MTTAITIIGLGPGRWDDLTLAAHACFAEAEQASIPVYFRTYIHPTVEPLRRAFPNLRNESFDSFYEESEVARLYQSMAERVCELGAQQPLLYAVPGHPLMAEASVQLILQLARAQGLSTRIVSGMSFLEPVCEALQLDPYMRG
jgi:tetrapyrrole methylase family protein / MazG family protein